MKIMRFSTGDLQENAYLLTDEATGRAAVIDPGAPDETLLQAVHELGDRVAMILLTHGHYDHIGAAEEIRTITGVPVYAAAEELSMLSDAKKNLSVYFHAPTALDGVLPLRDGDELPLGTLTVRAIHTPGHSMGGMCFLTGDALFSGDTLFAGSVGRTDFWGGDGAMLLRSVRRLMQLPGHCRVLPGHGEETTVAQERRSNPYCREESEF